MAAWLIAGETRHRDAQNGRKITPHGRREEENARVDRKRGGLRGPSLGRRETGTYSCLSRPCFIILSGFRFLRRHFSGWVNERLTHERRVLLLLPLFSAPR